jgi:hypothetical protein
VSIPARGYLLVFASDKDRRASGAPLHTSFALGTEGEYLALVRPDGTTIASQFAPAFPAQRADISYGIAAGGLAGYLETPTPGAANAIAVVPESTITNVNVGSFTFSSELPVLVLDNQGFGPQAQSDGEVGCPWQFVGRCPQEELLG